VPDAPGVAVRPTGRGADSAYHVSWQPPPDNGQIVLGYRVTAWTGDEMPTGTSTYVRSPAGYRTWVSIPATPGSPAPTFTVKALNQVGWSPVSVAVAPATDGPSVTVSSPSSWSVVARTFSVTVEGAPDQKTQDPPDRAWAEVGSSGTTIPCTSQTGAGPYTLTCDDTDAALSGTQLLVVHVQDDGEHVTTLVFPVRVQAD
jgi:hypothetical protein